MESSKPDELSDESHNRGNGGCGSETTVVLFVEPGGSNVQVVRAVVYGERREVLVADGARSLEPDDLFDYFPIAVGFSAEVMLRRNALNDMAAQCDTCGDEQGAD